MMAALKEAGTALDKNSYIRIQPLVYNILAPE
jgi:hypothetical protein